MNKITIEVCAASVQSAINAQLANAQRIELCSGLELGGLTPSYASIQLAREKLDIEIFVLIRPRSGDFHYSSLEFEIIKRDILFCKNFESSDGKKIDGVVIGLLEKNGNIDIARTKELVELASPMEVTFHRAFDRSVDPFLALEKIIETGATRILTSGQKSSAFEGKDLLKQLVEKANGRIQIMPGAGINADNILEIVKTTKAQDFHFSAKSLVKSKMTFQNELSGNGFYETEIEKVRKVVELVMKDER